eukprot:UN27806
MRSVLTIFFLRTAQNGLKCGEQNSSLNYQINFNSIFCYH